MAKLGLEEGLMSCIGSFHLMSSPTLCCCRRSWASFTKPTPMQNTVVVVGNNDVGGRGGGHCEPQPQNPKPNAKPSCNPAPRSRVSKTKSCSGFLYYSSVRKSQSKNPICIGFSETLHQFPSYIVGKAELEALKQGKNLANFKFACLGYSIHLDNESSSAYSQNKVPKLPISIDPQMLMIMKPSVSPDGHVPHPAHKKKHEHAALQPQSNKPPHVTGEEYFINRFKRNASLVASGVARNLNRVGNYVREKLDGILNPSRRGPK